MIFKYRAPVYVVAQSSDRQRDGGQVGQEAPSIALIELGEEGEVPIWLGESMIVAWVLRATLVSFSPPWYLPTSSLISRE